MDSMDRAMLGVYMQMLGTALVGLAVIFLITGGADDQKTSPAPCEDAGTTSPAAVP